MLTPGSLLLIRHAQSEHHTNQLTGGWTNTGLTPLGIQQATLLAQRLQNEISGGHYHLISSDLLRAQQTAEIIAGTLALQVHLAPALREYNNGLAAGLSKSAAQKFERPRQEPLLDWQPYTDAETWRTFYKRVVSGIEALMTEFPLPLILVTHGGTILNIVVWWLQLEIEYLGRISFSADPASLSILDISSLGKRRIQRLNDTSHLVEPKP